MTPYADLDAVYSAVCTTKVGMTDLIKRYVPLVSSIPLHQGFRWVPTWKALPTFVDLPDAFNSIKKEWRRRDNNCFTTLYLEIAAFVQLLTFTHSKGEQWSQGAIWRSRTRFAFDPMNKVFTGSDLDDF